MKSPTTLLRRLTALSLALLIASCGGGKKEQPMPADFIPPSSVPAFDGARSFSLLVRQVAFGPRVPNSDAHARCLDFYNAFFDSLDIEVEVQSFTLPGYDGEQLRLSNVIARIHPERVDRILLAAHWDTRPFADRETDPEAAKRPIPGANDGASGVAVLLHLAELLQSHPAPVGVDIVLFDGEDYGREGDESMFLLGSKYFSATLDAAQRYRFGILLDLVGDRDAEFPREELSRQFAGDVQDMLWREARRLGLSAFTDRPHSAILDDHLPLNTVAGIKTVNIIDAALVGGTADNPRRRYWHTLDDTPEQCSPETLDTVGRLLLSILYGIQPA
ncbi:MAG: M28 family peptidase [Bacteroidetes bacterium]|nr:M28 family peptidase [Bacteroidota bacterium]